MTDRHHRGYLLFRPTLAINIIYLLSMKTNPYYLSLLNEAGNKTSSDSCVVVQTKCLWCVTLWISPTSSNSYMPVPVRVRLPYHTRARPTRTFIIIIIIIYMVRLYSIIILTLYSSWSLHLFSGRSFLFLPNHFIASNNPEIPTTTSIHTFPPCSFYDIKKNTFDPQIMTINTTPTPIRCCNVTPNTLCTNAFLLFQFAAQTWCWDPSFTTVQ